MDFDDTDWESGYAPLARDDDIATVINSVNEKRKYITYFRIDFEVTKDSGDGDLGVFVATTDDHLPERREVIRYNMPVGHIGYRKLSVKMISGQEENIFTHHHSDSTG